MKTNVRVIAGFVFGLGVASQSFGQGPPPSLDRPTPPPCCADGICHPNPMEWGFYATRWRRWPTDYLEPLPPEVTPPPALGPDIPAFETPPPEEEDRRAPPPTAPRGDDDQAPAPPATTQPGTTTPAPTTTAPTRPLEPSTLPTQQPHSFPLDEPATSPLDTSPPPTTLPFGDDSPPPLPFGEPMGERDPAPAPPFAAPARRGAPQHRTAAPQDWQPAQQPIRAAQSAGPAWQTPIAMAEWVD